MKKPNKSAQKRNYLYNFSTEKHGKNDNLKVEFSSANRLTILPDFLKGSAQSEVVKKHEVEDNEQDNTLRSEIRGILKHPKTTTRKSKRLSKNSSANALREISYNTRSRARISNKENCDPCFNTPQQSAVDNSRNNSRSLIKTILTAQNNNNFNLRQEVVKKKHYPTPFRIPENPSDEIVTQSPILPSQTQHKTWRSSKSLINKILSTQEDTSLFDNLLPTGNQDISKGLNDRLMSKIKIQFRVNPIDDLRQKILKRIEEINSVLFGRVDTIQTMGTFKKPSSNNPEDVPECLFSPWEWQFATPPSQKLHTPICNEESAIQPAIFYNHGDGRNIYKLKKGVDPNLINHINPQCIEVDNRYMEQIAEFGTDGESYMRCEEKKNQEFNFKGSTTNRCLLERLATVHSRPKKSTKRLTFAEKFLRNMQEMSSFSDSQIPDYSKGTTSAPPDFEPMDTGAFDITFVNCSNNTGSETPPQKFKMVFKERARKLFDRLSDSE